MSADTFYRGFRIYHDPPPVPTRAYDWTYVHREYDGPEDHRHGSGPTLDACKAEIDEHIEGGYFE